MRQHQLGDFRIGNHARAFRVDGDVDRLGHADGVADLHLALARQAGRDDVFRHVAGRVGCRTVDFRWVLARERAAAVRGCATVGVDDDLAPGQAAIALRTADDETARRVDEEFGLGQPFARQDGLDDFFDDGFFDLLVRDFRRMLGRQHDRVHADGTAIDVAQGHLRFRVRTQPWQTAILAQLRLALDQAVRVVDGGRHQLGRFIAGVAEHQALVASALIQVNASTFIDALRDVRRLLVVGHQHGATLVVDAVFRVVVADAFDGLARNLNIIHIGVRGNFASQHHQTRVAQGFGSHAGGRVLSQDGVKDGVGNLIGNLVGMAFRDGFGSEEIVV